MSELDEYVRAMAILRRELAKPPVPSKRRAKQQSGRANHRRHNSQVWVRSVGGTTESMRAIYDGPDRQGTDVRDLCVVVDRDIKAVTDPGGTQPDYQPTGGYGYVGRVPCV